MAPIAGVDVGGNAVRQQLRDLIIRGSLQPGVKYTVRGLARALGTSTMPVRDALATLRAEGALEVLPNRSVCIPAISPARYFELCEIRAALEGLAAQWAVGSAPVTVAPQLATINRRYCAALKQQDRQGIFDANREFHFTLYSHSQAPALLRLIETAWLLTGPYINVTFRHGPASHIADDNHRAIIAAVARRDSEACRKAVIADIRDACAFTLTELNRERSGT